MSNTKPLSLEEQQKILDWLDKKWLGTKTCNICGHNQWNLSQHVVAPTTLEGKNISLGGTIYPLVLVTCKNCGNTHFFNVVMVGLLRSSSDPGSEPDNG